MVTRPKDQAISERLPVARVAVDISLAHLDRPFDYLVPASMDATAAPGCRVRVRFAGQLVDGYLLDRAFHTDFLYIVFLLVGIAAGFVQLVRLAMRDTRNDDNDGS